MNLCPCSFKHHAHDECDGSVAGELGRFWQSHAEWSQQAFGKDTDRGPLGPLNHLAKEVSEALKARDGDAFLEEMADILLLAFDATRRGGYSYQNLVDAAWAKLDKNMGREWQKPNEDGSVEHVRS